MVEKMKKALLWCLVCLVCLVPCSGAALAAEADAAQDAADGYVYDAAGLLTADEISDLNDEIASFMEESGWNVYAVTTDDAQGKSATAYADDFFDEHSPEQEDGVALLIDMDNREITISTCGIAIRYLTDSRIDNILDAAYAKISNGDYNGCMHSMLTGVENYYEKGISEGQYNYDSETGKISRYHVLTLGEIFGVLAVAIGAGCIIYFTISNSYKVRGKGYQKKEDYEEHERERSVLCIKGKGGAGCTASCRGGKAAAGFGEDGLRAGCDRAGRDQPEFFL